MFYNNPFAELATVIPAYVMQYFVVAMVLLIIVGVALDMLHKKNVVYFFRNAQKAKKSAKDCLLYTSPSPRDNTTSRMPSSA